MQFEVTIQDGTGSTTVMISDKIGEELLSLTVAAEIHEICCIKKQLLPFIPVQHKLLRKTFTIQIKKLFTKHKDASSAKLFIMSITKKDIASNLPLPLTAPTNSRKQQTQAEANHDKGSLKCSIYYCFAIWLAPPFCLLNYYKC